jgi:DNA polymerase-3 subunit alpha
MAVFILEDLQSATEVLVFPKTMMEYGPLLADDAVVCVKGRLDLREEPPKLMCLEIKRPELSSESNQPLRIKLSPSSVSGSMLDRLKGLLRDHPGEMPVHVHLGRTILRLPDEFRVDSGNGLYGELRVLLGADGLLA